jgi:hypothetical protein
MRNSGGSQLNGMQSVLKLAVLAVNYEHVVGDGVNKSATLQLAVLEDVGIAGTRGQVPMEQNSKDGCLEGSWQ